MPSRGKYGVAVSGGIDSVALLHLLHEHSQTHRQLHLVVAHLDHGMRPDSDEDRRFVQALAHSYGLPFEHERINLGPGASEAVAREARYQFLYHTKQKVHADAIFTAHHQDDLIETAIINLIRGSGRRGLTSLANRPSLLRPLLAVPKTELQAYAQTHNLSWREDSTNQDDTYLRNYIRHHIVPRFSVTDRRHLLIIINNLTSVNQALDELLTKQLKEQTTPGTVTRLWFNNLPHAVAKEVLAAWLRDQSVANFDKKTLEQLVIAAKTGRPGRRYPIKGKWNLKVETTHLALLHLER